MRLQYLQMPQSEFCTDEAMYFKRNGKTEFLPDDHKIVMYHNAAVSFDTYFNSFSADKWFRYTQINSVRLRLYLKGMFQVQLLQKTLLPHHKIHTKLITKMTVGSHQGNDVYTFDFENNHSGMLCFELKCVGEKGEFCGGYYESSIDQHNIRPVKIALDICTYKREEFVKRNIKNINAYAETEQGSLLKDKFEIFISDNAATLPLNEFAPYPNVHLFRNKNTGGAGGFTRGMIEAAKLKQQLGLTHLLLMDDDILFNPDSLYRTFVIFSLVKDEYQNAFLGGAMLRLDTRYIQTESGANWNKGNLISYKQGLDMRRTTACLFNEKEEDTEYNAWWYCAFPINIANDNNLPLPIFIRGDDVEYGLRNTRQLILMNGICVWHEPFENKYSSSMYYYIFRNRLIDNSVRDLQYSRKEFVRDLRSQVLREILYFRYKNAELLMNGTDDFFAGIDHFKTLDGEKLNQEIISNGYTFRELKELGVAYDQKSYQNALDIQDKNKIAKLCRRALLNGLLLPSKKYPSGTLPAVPTYKARPINFYRVRKVLNYDSFSGKGFITEKSLKKTFALTFRLFRLSFRSRLIYRKITNEYKNRSGELTNLSFWKQYLDL